MLHSQFKARSFRRHRRDWPGVEGRGRNGEAAGGGERGNVYVEPLAGEELYCLMRLLEGVVLCGWVSRTAWKVRT